METDATATEQESQFGHVPVLRDRMGDLLAPAIENAGEHAVIVDGTLGAGGHTEYFLQRFPNLRIIGVDRDGNELSKTQERLASFPGRVLYLRARFDDFGDLISESDDPIAVEAKRSGLAGGFFDLGVSSMQLDQADRGFSYRFDGPLDMRMDTRDSLTAETIVNTYTHGDIARILKTYGDERFAGKIASAIVSARESAPITSASTLVELIYSTIPAAARRHGGHPAKRTFQALRVAVNSELEAIERVIPVVTDNLAIGGRAVFMSYQSHEDKLVKTAFAELTASKTPAGLPMDLPGTEPDFKLLRRGSEKASAAEIEQNPRAASVRVRVLERTNRKTNTHFFGGRS